MPTDNSITQYFGRNLAELLSEKIEKVYPDFNSKNFHKDVEKGVEGKSYTQRVEFIAHKLHDYLPDDYKKSVKILLKILGPENPNETGMFKEFYWIMPIGKYVEMYGLENEKISMNAIEEITKRNTGEYAIRPYIRQNPDGLLRVMKRWAKSENFHLRRLASEGLRPKLPWAPKLDIFNDNPQPVFDILELLKEDDIKFVQKSVGNHLTDWLKVNPEPAKKMLKRWQKSNDKNTQWIVKRATRKIPLT